MNHELKCKNVVCAHPYSCWCRMPQFSYHQKLGRVCIIPPLCSHSIDWPSVTGINWSFAHHIEGKNPPFMALGPHIFWCAIYSSTVAIVSQMYGGLCIFPSNWIIASNQEGPSQSPLNRSQREGILRSALSYKTFSEEWETLPPRNILNSTSI